MPLLIDAARLTARRQAAAGPLAPLADALAAELEPLLEREPFVPEEKARLTRTGGWCPRDGARLGFDPWSPHEHRCPACGTLVTGDEHYRMWIMWYQLWLAERAVHGAVLYALRGEETHASLARTLLGRWSELYARYPDRDNALGPTRPFFSTYLESIWLLQLCVAVDLLEQADGDSRRTAALGETLRERVIEPSRRLIASFDERGSNRQVWNDAALLASARLLDHDEGVRSALFGPSGFVAQLARGLLADGTWFEGENYHLFAHRALWYGVTMAETAGISLPPDLVARFEEGFATPFLTALPDLTLPARRDSQYSISLRQWRFAELCELGLARREDVRLIGALHELYGGDAPRVPTGRDRSAAEVERNTPATALGRADLGWRSLLHARPALPPLEPHAPHSVLMEGQGLAILRRARGRVYASLDYGHTGGGHGHPDRLNLQLADGATRWLDDPGTGSYVHRSLHWYRSTLAHSAPLVDGASQARVDGELLAWDQVDRAGWVRASAAIAPGVRTVRTVVALDDYLIDLVEWRADREIVLDLPVHLDGELTGVRRWDREPLAGGSGVEDGFEFLRDTEHALIDAATEVLELAGENDGARIHVHLHARGGQWWRATGPAPPGMGDARFHLVRMQGPGGRLVAAWSWSAGVKSLEVADDSISVVRRDGKRHRHVPTADGWRVELDVDGTRHELELRGIGGLKPSTSDLGSSSQEGRPLPRPLPVPFNPPPHGWLVFELGESDYRRSEQPWREAGAPSASVRLAAVGDSLVIDVVVRKMHPQFVAADAENPFDNEQADIDGDGLQLYVTSGAAGGGDRMGGWMLVPEPDAIASRVRVRPIAGHASACSPTARAGIANDGWQIEARVPLACVLAPGERTFRLGVIVNTITPGRERRAGQLVLGGAAGEWTYLAGDRHAPYRLVPLVLPHD